MNIYILKYKYHNNIMDSLIVIKHKNLFKISITKYNVHI